MALPPEQRPAYYAAVRKRAEELMATGMSMGEAAQQAYSEIAPSPQSVVRETATLESEEAAKALDKTRAKYVDQRAEVLSKEGVTRPSARAQAEREFEEEYLKPVTGGYGEISERQGTGAFGLLTPAAPKSLSPRLTGAKATLGEALAPQTELPRSAIPTETRRMERPAQAEIIGAGPDYALLRNRFIDSGLTPGEADMQVDAFKSAYDHKLSKYPAGTKDIAKKAWEDTIMEIDAIPKALADKASYTKDYVPTGPQDSLFLAFSRQVKAGEGVPTLSVAQGRYIDSLARSGRAAEEARLRKEYADKPLVVAEQETVEGLRGGGTRTVNRELVGEEKEAKIKQMAAEKVEVPWWSNPEEVQRRLKLGTEEKKGIFSSETAFGTQRESNIGYLARTGLAPLNAIAGAAFPILFTGTGETSKAIEEARRRARPEAYKDSPILLNIAEGRGFVGEAAEVARLTGINTDEIFAGITYGDIYTAGAFAADLLDPSLDIVAAGIRGARTGIEAAGVARKLGATTKEAAKIAGGAILSGDVRLAISNKMSEKVSEELLNPTRRATSNALPIVKTVDDKLNRLDNLVDDVRGASRLSKEEFIEALGDAAARDPNVRNLIRDAEMVGPVRPGAGINQKQINVVQSNVSVRNAVKESLIRNTVRNEVFKATKDSVLRNGLVALTPRTYSTASDAKKILQDASKTQFMQELPRITKSPVVGIKNVQGLAGGARQATVVDGYKLTPQERDIVKSQLDTMANRGRIPQPLYNQINTSLRQTPEFISANDLRIIIDAQIDDVAASYRIVRGGDIAETSPIVARELTEPLQTKDFTNPFFRKWLANSTFLGQGGKTANITDALTPVQRQLFDEVSGKLGKMDAKLRNDMQRIMSDNEVRRLYDIPPGANLNREQLMGHLIVGPGKTNIVTLQRTLKLAIDKLIYGVETKQDIFDIFTGIKVDEVSDVWSTKGRTELDKLIKTAALNIENAPETYASVLQKLNEDATALARSADNLKIPIEDVKVLKGKLSEQLVASFYAAEANRLLNESYVRILASEGGRINEAFSTNLRQGAKDYLKTLGEPVEVFGEAIGKYINALAENPRFAELSNDVIIDIIGLTPQIRFTSAAQGYEFLKNRDDIIAEIDVIAKRIMKNSGIATSKDYIGDLMRIINKASIKGGPIEANLQAILGPNVAEQLQGALNAGGAKNIEDGLAKALRGTDKTAKGIVTSLWNWLTEAWYTLVLTASPRFHGANIVGAPEVIFTTTGKLISPFPIPGTSTWDAMRIMQKAGGPEGGAIAVRDPAGRTYTNNEIYEALSQRGGETAFKADIPSIAARRALIQLQGGPVGAVRRALDTIIESPQTEDTLYRMAVAVEELKAGRPMDSAIRLARSALMDKGTITEAERVLQRSIMFYSFTRNNFVNLMKNLMTPEGWSRIARVVKTKRGVENVLMPMSEEEKAYLPETAALRIVVGRGENIGEKGSIIALPNSSTFSAIELLSKFLAVDTEYFTDMLLAREISLIKDVGEIEVERIPPEHVFIIEAIADVVGAKPEDVMSILAGEPVIPFKSDEPGNIRGLVYPLTSPNARSNYKMGLTALKFIGIDRLMSDIPNSLRAPGGKVAEAIRGNNLGAGTMGYAAGFISPLKTQMAEKQRLRTLLSQNAEGRKLVKDIDEVLIGDIIQPIAAEPQRVEEVREQKKEIAQEKREISNIEGEILRLANEIKSLIARIRVAESDAEAEALEKRIEQIELRIEELEALEEQSNR